MEDNIIEIENLTLTDGKDLLTDGISLILPRGQTTGLVGESGSGKTLTALSILNILPPKIKIRTGIIRFSSNSGSTVVINQLPQRDLNSIRGGKISMIFQEPMTSLNPAMTCGNQIMESILRHKKISREQAKQDTLKFIREVRLPEPERIFKSWPHQLSGGQRQRIMIAMALSTRPELLIADEPTTALDVTVQKDILELLRSLGRKYKLSVLFITHDLMVLKQIADRISVMYRGQIIESGPAETILNEPQEDYTKALIACKPGLEYNPDRLPTIADFMNNKGAPEHEIRNSEVDYGRKPLLIVKDLNTWFPLKKKGQFVRAVNNVSFEVYRGETLGLVGESGSGKTTLGRSILRLIESRSGDIFYKGENLGTMTPKQTRAMRKEIQVVFQDPYSSLNPRFTVARLLIEPMEIHRRGRNGRERIDLAASLLEQVGLRPEDLQKYPHQFSGGQRQRICIARALACQPEFIILDESVSALDVSIQAQILNLLNDMKNDYNLTYIFISHDLTVVKYMSDRVVIMNSGEIVESGTSEKIYMAPEADYTKKLIGSIPQ